ncbi:MAG: hypothetical protein QXJ75_00595 [Candidatus Bathyarchaeia archaeon]
MDFTPKKDKKFIAVRGDLLQKIIEIANKDGKSVYGFVNEIFEQAIRADELKLSLSEVVEFYSLIEIMKKAGAVITPADTLDHLISRLYPLEKESLQERWYLSGVWYGKYLSTRFNDALGVFKKLLEACIWNISEANLSINNDGTISLRCVAPNQSRESTELFSKFLKGVFSALNYKAIKEEFWRGIILMELKRHTPLDDIELGIEKL